MYFKRMLVGAVLGVGLLISPMHADTTVDLLAGQTLKVGQVTVSAIDGSTLQLQYEITVPGWCMTEAHAHVATSEDDIPQNRQGHPQVGQFDHNVELNCATNHTATFLVGNTAIQWYVAAHAVVERAIVCEEGDSTLFGVERTTGDLYTINATAMTTALLTDVADPAPGNINSPNGLAYDPILDRLYFSASASDAVTSSDLYFRDADNVVNYSGSVPGVPAGATAFTGAYYYFPNGTDDLYKVDFNLDGTVDSVIPVCLDVTSAPDKQVFRFGDIVISLDGSTLYGSTNTPTYNQYFTIDLPSCEYQQVCTAATGVAENDGGCAIRKQLAWASDGELIGHSTASGSFYTIDPVTGIQTALPAFAMPSDNFTDTASGICSADETGWGAGSRFVDKGTWATYFVYEPESEE